MIRSRSYFTRSATFNAVFNYTFGRGKRPHQGPFNETTQNVLGYWSLSRSLNPLYKDGTALIRRSSDNETMIVQVNQETGIADPAQVRAFNGWNLLRHTEAFDNAYWTKGDTSATAATPPAGYSQAWKLAETATSALHYIGRLMSDVYIASTQYTLSVVAKASERTAIALVAESNGQLRCDFNLSNGTFQNIGVGASGAIQSLGDGWYRCSMRFTPADIGGATTYLATLQAVNGSLVYSGTLGSGVLITGFQLEQASSFSTYEPRTTTGAGDSFLVTLYEQAENGRNLLARTEEFDVLPWGNVFTGTGVASTVTANAGTSPVGDSTADRIQFDLGGGTTSNDISRRVQSFTPAAGTYTYSIYIRSYDGVSNYNMHIVGPTGATTNIAVTGSWQRFTVSGTAIGIAVQFCLGLRGGQSPANSNTADVLVWGAQLEVGTTATTYERRTTHGAGTRLNFTQATTTLQPIVCEQGVVVTENNRLSAKYVAADARRLSIPSSTNLFNALHTTGGSILCVSKCNDTAAAKAILSSASSSTGAGFRMTTGSNEVIGYLTGRLDVAGVATSGNSIVLNGANSQASSLRINAAVLDPDNGTAASRVSYWENGTQGASTNAQTGTPFVENAADNLTLGATSAGGSPHDGTISELCLFSSLISTADRLRYEANASRHYGITITESLVSISAHPSSVTTTIDYPYTMTVVASNATAYQWQYSTDGGTTWLPGNSNTDSITVTTTPAMNGWRWRCVVMNPFGGVISNSATVTVEPLALEGLSIVSSLGGAWSTSRRVLPSYSRTSEVILIRRDSDNATLPVPGDGLLSEIDPNEVRAFNGWNLFARTAEFTNAAWIKTLGIGLVAVDGVADNYGTTTAATLTPNAGTDFSYIAQNRDNLAVGSSYTITAEFKANGYDWIQITGSTGFLTADWRNFNIATGAVGNGGGASTYSITSLGNGWYRVSFSMICQSSVSASRIIVAIYPTDVASRLPTTSTFNGTSGVIIARPQFERAASFSTFEPRTTTGAGSSFLVTKYDQTGQGRHLTQSTTTLQPIVCEQGVPVTESGRQSAKYVAADARRMTVAFSAGLFNALHTTGGSVLIVSRANDTASIKCLLGNKSASTDHGSHFYYSAVEALATDIGRQDVAGVATNGLTASAGHHISASTSLNVSAFAVDPDNATASERVKIWLNGTIGTSANIQTATPFVENARGIMTLGARENAANLPHDGTISEAVIASAIISTSDRDAWESRTGSFFGVSVT